MKTRRNSDYHIWDIRRKLASEMVIKVTRYEPTENVNESIVEEECITYNAIVRQV